MPRPGVTVPSTHFRSKSSDAILQNRVVKLTESLAEEVKTSLSIYDLGTTVQVAQELNEQLLAEEPHPALIRQSVRILAPLGHIECPLLLMAGVWACLLPLLYIAEERVG